MPYKDPYLKYLYDIKYQIENRESIKKQRDAHYQQTREQQLKKCKEYRLAHSEELKQKCRIYHDIHRDQLNKDAKEYYATHREEQKENNRKYYMTHQKEVITYRFLNREKMLEGKRKKALELKLKAYSILGNNVQTLIVLFLEE